MEKVQAEILRMDDIDEFDSDNENENANHSTSFQMTNSSSRNVNNCCPNRESNPQVFHMNNPTASIDSMGRNPARGSNAAAQAPGPLKAVNRIANPYKTKVTKAAVSSGMNQDSIPAGVANSLQNGRIRVPVSRPLVNNPYANRNNKRVASNPLKGPQPDLEPAETRIPEQGDDNTGVKVIGNRVLMDL